MNLFVIVTGGRNYSNKQKVWDYLDNVDDKVCGRTIIVQGGASGADSLAREWAKDRGRTFVTWEAHWKEYGPSAGPRRNISMLEAYISKDPIVFAFPGGIGTKHCVTEAKKRNFRVIEVEE